MQPPLTRGAPERTEQDLLAAARGGDMTAFAELWRRYQRFALKTARGLTTKCESEDLAAEAFARILQSLRNGAGPSRHFAPYLRQAIRSAAMRDARPESSEYPLESADSLPSPDEFAHVDNRLIVRDALAEVSAQWRDVLWLSEVEGRPSAEVAVTMGLTVPATRALAYRARQYLRRHLGDRLAA
jgi:RNA polymerase sigma factor (sigma-70 family)